MMWLQSSNLFLFPPICECLWFISTPRKATWSQNWCRPKNYFLFQQGHNPHLQQLYSSIDFFFYSQHVNIFMMILTINKSPCSLLHFFLFFFFQSISFVTVSYTHYYRSTMKDEWKDIKMMSRWDRSSNDRTWDGLTINSTITCMWRPVAV